MQTNINKSTENSTQEFQNEIDELLIENRDIFKRLVTENVTRREKSFMIVKEYELIKQFEQNLVSLLKQCPPDKVQQILAAINDSPVE